MNDAVIVALITGAVTLSGNLLANWSIRKKEAIERAVEAQKLEDQIKQISQKLDEHNSYGDKIASIEKAIVKIDTKLETIQETYEET